MHEIKVSILHFLCLSLKRRTFHYQYHGGNKTQQHELRFQLLQNVDGNIVEYSHFCIKKKNLIKVSCYLPLLESSADVSECLYSQLD